MTNAVKKVYIKNIGLLAGAVLLITVIWLTPEKEPDKKPISEKLAKADVTEIRIEHGDKPSMLLVKKADNDWRITTPMQAFANPHRIKSLLNILTGFSYSQYDIGELDLKDFGLEPAIASVYFNGEAVLFGDLNPTSNNRYTLMNNTLHVVPDFYLGLMTAPIGNYVDLQIIPERFTVVKFNMADFIVKQQSDKRWQLTPFDDTIHYEAIDRWVNKWLELRGGQVFVSPPITSQDHKEIAFTLANGETLKFKVIKEGEWLGLYNQEADIGYSLLDWQIERFTALPTNIEKPVPSFEFEH